MREMVQHEFNGEDWTAKGKDFELKLNMLLAVFIS